MEPTTLTTERLLLRPFAPEDADAAYAACQDPDIQRWTMVPSPYDPRTTRNSSSGTLSPTGGATDTTYNFAVLLRDGGPLVGALGARPLHSRRAARRAGLLDGEGAPRRAATPRRRCARWPAGRSPTWARTAWSGGPRSATTAPGPSPAGRASAWRVTRGRPCCNNGHPAGRLGRRPASRADRLGLPGTAPSRTGPAPDVSGRASRVSTHDRLCRRPLLELSADQARRIALRAQGLLGAPDRRGGVRGVLRRLGAVQLDTISVLARSHELVPYARLGALGRRAVDEAYWSGGRSFEYWSHAACILPVEEWPHFAFRRRAYRATAALEPRPARRGVRDGDRPAARRGPADGDGARRREERRGVVGLVGVQGRRRAGPDVRRGGVHRAARLEAGLRPGRAGDPGRRAPRRPGRQGVPAPAGGPGGAVAGRGHPDGHRRLPPDQGRAVRLRRGGLGAGPGVGAGLGEARLGPPRRPRLGAARTAPYDAAVAVRLTDLGAGAHGADLRLHPPPGGVRPPAQADPRLLRDAAAGGRQTAGPGRPGQGGDHAGRPPGVPGRREVRGARWPRPSWRRRPGSAARTYGWSVSTHRSCASRSWRRPPGPFGRRRTPGALPLT